MKRLIRTLLWSVASAFLAVRSYQEFKNQSSDLLWFAPSFLILVAALTLFSAFESYRNTGDGKFSCEAGGGAEPLTRTERIVFKALGVPVILVGLVMLVLSGWLAWGQWIRVAQWPRVDATLMSKDTSSVGARLVFSYEVGGRRFTGRGFRWGSEQTVRTDIESYQPGTIQRISYNPEDPSQVETILSYSWELSRVPIFAVLVGVFLSVGGVVVHRWSCGAPVASPPRD